MLDFVDEGRPRTMGLTTECPTDFVAEVRPSSRHARSDYRFYPKSLESEMILNHMTTARNDDLELDVNDVLFNKSISKDKVTKVMHSTIVQLVNTLLNGYSVTRIQGCINVSISESCETISVDLNETYGHYQKCNDTSQRCADLDRGIKRKANADSPMCSPVLEETSCPEDYNNFGKYSPPFLDRDVPYTNASPIGSVGYHENRSPSCESSIESNFPEPHAKWSRRKSELSLKSDSAEESGYSSNERESVSDEVREELSDTQEGEVNAIEDTRYATSSRENIEKSKSDLSLKDIEEERESELVIDLSIPTTHDEDMIAPKHTLALRVNDIDGKEPSLTTQEEEMCHSETKSESFDDHDVMEGPRRDIDATVPMDLSGDCKINANIRASEELETLAAEFSESIKLACKKCPAMLSGTRTYEEHTLQEHQLYACSICLKDFSSKNNLKRHVRIHTGSRPYKCNQCVKSFARKDDLKGHTLKHDFSKPFRCSLCRKGYTDRACVKNHMLREHCSRLMRICPQCGESFDREETFLEHKKTHPSLKQFACDTCPFIGTNHLMALKHQLLHSYKLFSCKPCNAYFADPFGYTKHVKKHKKTKNYNCYVCSFCDVTLPTYEQYVRHEYSHAQGKLYECNVCQKQFKNKTSILEHSLVHSDVKTHDKPETTETKDSIEMDKVETEMDCLEVEGKSVRSPVSEICCMSLEKQSCHQASLRDVSLDRNECDDIVPDNQDSSEGKLLDLSLKPVVLDKASLKRHASIFSDEYTAVADIPSPRTSNVSNHCVPRNGYADSDMHVQGQGKSAASCCLADNVKSPQYEELQIVWQSPIVDDGENKNATRTEKLPMSSVPLKQKDGSRLEQVVVRKRENNVNVRYHPYAKMFDLASKIIEARCGGNIKHKLLKEIGNTQLGSLLKNDVSATLAHQGGPPRVDALENNFSKSPGMTKTLRDGIDSIPSNTIIGLSGKVCPSPGMTEECSKKKSIQSTLKQECLSPDDVSVAPASFPRGVTKEEFSGRQQQQCNQIVKSRSSRHDCKICSASFESFFELESHSVVKHSRYLCEFCGQGFTARPNRDRHVRYHTGERPYKCDLCPKAFFRGDDLKYHRTTRHPSELISCKSCATSFTWQKDLDKHMRHSKCDA